MEGFYRKKDRAKNWLATEDLILLDQKGLVSSLGGKGRQSFIMQMPLLPLGPWTDSWSAWPEKFPDCLIKIKFLGKAETSIRSGIKSKRQGPYGGLIDKKAHYVDLQMKNKSQWSVRSDQDCPNGILLPSLVPTFSKLRPPDSTSAYMTFLLENFFLGGVEERSVRKRENAGSP